MFLVYKVSTSINAWHFTQTYDPHENYLLFDLKIFQCELKQKDKKFLLNIYKQLKPLIKIFANNNVHAIEKIGNHEQ